MLLETEFFCVVCYNSLKRDRNMLKTHQHEGNQLPFMISSIFVRLILFRESNNTHAEYFRLLEIEFFCVVCYNSLKRDRNLKTHQHEGNQLPFMISSIFVRLILFRESNNTHAEYFRLLEIEFFCVVCYNSLKRDRNMLKTHQHEGNQLPFMISSIICSTNLISR